MSCAASMISRTGRIISLSTICALRISSRTANRVFIVGSRISRAISPMHESSPQVTFEKFSCSAANKSSMSAASRIGSRQCLASMTCPCASGASDVCCTSASTSATNHPCRYGGRDGSWKIFVEMNFTKWYIAEEHCLTAPALSMRFSSPTWRYQPCSAV